MFFCDMSCLFYTQLQMTVYRKLTNFDRLLDVSSYNPTSHKATAIKTLRRRLQLVCDALNSLHGKKTYMYMYLECVFTRTTTKQYTHWQKQKPNICCCSDYNLN